MFAFVVLLHGRRNSIVALSEDVRRGPVFAMEEEKGECSGRGEAGQGESIVNGGEAEGGPSWRSHSGRVAGTDIKQHVKLNSIGGKWGRGRTRSEGRTGNLHPMISREARDVLRSPRPLLGIRDSRRYR